MICNILNEAHSHLVCLLFVFVLLLAGDTRIRYVRGQSGGASEMSQAGREGGASEKSGDRYAVVAHEPIVSRVR